MEQRNFVCRNCFSNCPILVTLDGDRVVKVEGDLEAPVYRGYICPKGRALPRQYHDPDRLLHSLKRLPNGTYEPISSERLIEEVAARLSRIVDAHGVRAVAAYIGNGGTTQPATKCTMFPFMAAIGSPLIFSASTLDQPGLMIAKALHGDWQGGRIHPDRCETMLMVGGNPVVSKQHMPQNPAWQLKQHERRGARMIVVDPRRTETARRAAIHLPIVPGEDPTLLAGLIHLIFELDGLDEQFVAKNATGVDELRDAVAGFDPDYVAARTGVDRGALVAAARILIEAHSGDIALGVGPSMATRGSLTSYLALCIQTLRGFWSREGESVSRPKMLLPARDWRAQPMAPAPAWGFGLRTSVRGLQQTSAGLPAAALPELMQTKGPDRIRALFVHAGPYYSWPDVDKTVKALGELDLMIITDTEFSANAALADYVVATYDQLETPAMSQGSEQIGDFHPGYDWTEPYAYYRPALLNPPVHADLIEGWQFYYRVARKLGLRLDFHGFNTPPEGIPLDMTNEPSTDGLFELMCRGSAIPLAEVKRHPHGALFAEARGLVGPREPGCTARLQLADAAMLGELAAVRAEGTMGRHRTDPDYPFQLICRRMMASTNGGPRPNGIVRTGYNPLWMHPDDMAALGVRDGDAVELRSRRGAIPAFVEADADLRRGVAAMTHGFGPKPNTDYDPRRDGSNINEILSWEDDPDPYHGMPRMSAVPVAIRATIEAGPAL